jgi:hypothetical protein
VLDVNLNTGINHQEGTRHRVLEKRRLEHEKASQDLRDKAKICGIDLDHSNE